MSARMGLMDGDYPTPEARKAFYDGCCASSRATPEFEAVALTNRFRMVFSGNGPIEIEGKAVQREPRPAERELRAGHRRLLRRHRAEAARRPHFHRRRSRQPSAGRRSSTPLSRGSTSATRARSAAGSAPWPATASSPARGGRSSASSRPCACSGPFNQPNVDDTRLLRAVLREPVRAGAAGAVRQPVRHDRRQAARRPARRRHGGRRCGSAVAKVDPNLPLYFVGTPKAQLDGFVAQNRIIATMFSIFGVVAIVLASVGMYGVMSFSVNQRHAGVRRPDGARRALQPHPPDGAAAGRGAAGDRAGPRRSAWRWRLATVAGAGIQNILFGVSARDPLTYGVVVGAGHGGVARRDARPGAPRHARRSDGRAARGVASAFRRISGR